MADPRSPDRGTGRQYPHAERTGVVDDIDGRVVHDPYRWLEDPRDPRTVDWIAAQDALFAEHRSGWPQASAWTALVTRSCFARADFAPCVRGDRTFFLRRDPGADHPVLYVHDGAGVRPVLDPQALDPSGATVLEAWHPSVEGTLLAYQLSAGGTEDAELRVLDVDTGEAVDGPIDRVRRSPVAWLPGGHAFYLVRRLPPQLVPGEARYHRRVYLHTVGEDPDKDVLVFGEGRDKAQFYTVAVSADGRWLMVNASQGTDPGADSWLADLHAASPQNPDLRPFHQATGARTRADLRPGRGMRDALHLRTDLDAPRGRIVTATPANPAPDAWRELIGQRPDAVLEDFATLDGPALARPLVVLLWRRHAISKLTVHDLLDGTVRDHVRLPGTGTVSGLATAPGGGHEAWFCYTDFTTPPRILRYDATTASTTTWPDTNTYTDASAKSAPPVPRTRQERLTSRDGTVVRMFVVSSDGRPDRPRPAILTGYGGFGASNLPGYLPHVLAWVRSGGVFAIAGLRGGGEEGRQWHLAGRAENKQNVFDDFAAAADHLAEAGWTTPRRLGILGGSNGGLLVNAALTQHPEKFAAAVSMDPLADMVRYERFGLGPSWRGEYGSIDDPTQRDVLLSYSPYHRVRPGTAYPPTLLTAALSDTRVDPLHARKMCAALQHASAGPAPILLRIERGVGHGARAMSKTDALFADALAFLGHHLGLDAYRSEQ